MELEMATLRPGRESLLMISLHNGRAVPAPLLFISCCPPLVVHLFLVRVPVLGHGHRYAGLGPDDISMDEFADSIFVRLSSAQCVLNSSMLV